MQTSHALAFVLYLEKAYDTTWKHGILSDLWDLGFRRHLPTCIDGFLSDRFCEVRVGSTLCELHEQEMGVPQGSILSPALFSTKNNNIAKSVLKGTDSSLFLDDCALCVRGRSVQRVERAMQLCLNSVQNWISKNGFKVSISKTVCMHFCRQNGVSPEPNNIIVLDKYIAVVKEAKCVGLIFDPKLTFQSHIQYLKTSCLKALDIIRVVGQTDWGADRTVLPHLYRSLVRSKLDYGSIVYGSALKSLLKQLGPIHH